MSTKNYSKEEFLAIVNELESQIEAFAKSESQDQAQSVLAKSEDESEKAEDKKEESKEEAKASEETPSDKKEEKSETTEKKQEDSDEDSHGYDDEDMEEMNKMYDSMSKGELKAHKSAMEKCWMAKCGEMTKPAEMTKSEKQVEVQAPTESKPEESTLLKSEIDRVNKENEELKKNLEGIVSALTTYVTKKPAPTRKAVTDIEFVKKSEEGSEQKSLSKSEITSILKKKASDPTLSSSDREAINQFYSTNGSLEKIQHLIKQ